MANSFKFAEVALPIAVRQTFTYSIPDSMSRFIEMGKRVWIPFKQKYAIGMVVKLHDDEPAYSVKPIKRVLDKEPVLSNSMLDLIQWMHRYYYCSLGEVVNAVLPLGLNFQTVSKVTLQKKEYQPTSSSENEIIEILKDGDYKLPDLEKRLKHNVEPLVDKLVAKGIISRWDEPLLKVEPARVVAWIWNPDKEMDVKLRSSQWVESKKKWERAISILVDLKPPFTSNLKEKYSELTDYTFNKLVNEKILIKKEIPKNYIIEGFDYEPDNLRKLNAQQHAVYLNIRDKIRSHQFYTLLINGITGSGKTEVYIHALKEVIESGGGGLILVPEIALTPQTVRRFYEIFGDKIAVLHSRLNQRERLDAWNQLKAGEKSIAIGARSALFAPVQNLRLIIIDEEHDASYRQIDPSPRYHARETAVMRAYLENLVVVMGSATPDVVTLYRSQKGLYDLNEISARHGNAMLPDIHLIDLKKYKQAMRGPLAVPLYLAITSRIERGEQVILLYNRRGFSSFLLCENCGQIFECPNCSVTLTYHKNSHSFRCHYCGHSKVYPKKCDKCNHSDLSMHGTGTQKIEEEIITMFPQARVLRMDQDSTKGKDGHNRVLEIFRQHEADIMIGTQLVSKGLDFENVTLVGVINADTELAFPSYNSSERMFQLLNQVSGRSGRGAKKGEVYIQTWKPEHPAVYYACNHNYNGFTKYLIKERAGLAYPPFSKMILFECKSKFYDKALTVAEALVNSILEINEKWPVLGPAPSSVIRIKKEYRWEVFLKINAESKSAAIDGLITKILDRLKKKNLQSLNQTRINIHVDI